MRRFISYLLVLRYVQALKDIYAYNQGNQLTEDRHNQYQYDNNGNLIKKTEWHDGKPKTHTYTYDYENRLIKVEIQKDNRLKTVSFTYDPFGRRISKTVQREEIDDDDDDDNRDYIKTIYYVYDNEDIILEYNQKGKVKARYIHGLGIDEPLAVEQKGDFYYYHADGLGSIVALTDIKQKVVQSYTYDSFGNLKHHGHKVKQPYTYTAREWDKEIGLYFYRARYYDAEGGIFTTPDPLNIARVLLLRQNSSTSVSADQIYNLALRNPQMLNEFSYATNNPLTYTDPYGEMSQIVGGVIAIGGTGALIGFTACMDNCIGGIRNANRERSL